MKNVNNNEPGENNEPSGNNEPGGNNNNEPGGNNNEPHTERELELEKAVASLTEKVKELTAVNQKLYVRLGGEQHDDTRTDAEKTDDRLRKFISSHFNRATLKEDE